VYVIKIIFFKYKIFIFRDFEKLEQEEEQELVPDEPEIRINREELIARYQVNKYSFEKFHLNFVYFKRLLKLNVIVYEVLI
jgi:hypothetical protein